MPDYSFLRRLIAQTMKKNKLAVDYICDWNWILKKKENINTIEYNRKNENEEELKGDRKHEGKEEKKIYVIKKEVSKEVLRPEPVQQLQLPDSAVEMKQIKGRDEAEEDEEARLEKEYLDNKYKRSYK
jgi:hypothetical protein